MSEIEVGDYVEVDIGMGLGAIGIVVSEKHYGSLLNSQSVRGLSYMSRNTATSYRIKFLDESLHTALESECRKLSDKELFKVKLSNDKSIREI